MNNSANTGIISGENHLSLVDLALNSRKAASKLASLGVTQGERIALLLRNDFCFFEATQGAALLGASTVPLNWHLTPDEIAYILRDCNARVLIVHLDLFPPAVQAITQAIGLNVIVAKTPKAILDAYRINTQFDMPSGFPEWQSAITDSTPWETAPVPIIGPMFYTSGTTGTPKGVQRSGNVPTDVAIAAQKRTLSAYGLDLKPESPAPRSIMTGPLYHSAPNAYGMNVIRSGGLLVLQARFDAADCLKLIEQYSITHLHMVPTMFVRLLALPKRVRQQYKLSSLRCVVHGSAPCAPEIKKQMIDWWGPVICEYYAMTETGIISNSNSAQWLAYPGTVGRAALGIEIRIHDDADNQLPAGVPGEISIRSATTNLVSYHRAEAKTSSLRRNGFLYTGDIGYLNTEGFLFISDRKTDMIISGGVNIYPAEIEAVILQLSGIKDVAVFGMPDVEMGECVVAVIEREDENLTDSDILIFLRTRLASYKRPRKIIFSMPILREDSGKIKKRLLRDNLLARNGIAQ